MSDDERSLSRGAERILRAAVEVIAERGFRSASTSEIARRAEVAEGTIFRHFKTKQLLLQHIVDPFVRRVIAPVALQDVRRLLDADYASFADLLRTFARNRLDVAREHLPVVRILLQELPVNPELRTMLVTHVGGQIAPAMLATIRRYQARGELSDDPPEAILRMILSSFGGYMLARFVVLPDREWRDDDEIERMVRVITRGFAPAPPAAPGPVPEAS